MLSLISFHFSIEKAMDGISDIIFSGNPAQPVYDIEE